MIKAIAFLSWLFIVLLHTLTTNMCLNRRFLRPASDP